MEAEPLVGNADLVIDRTGVGRPVFDIFEDMGLEPWGVTITAGRTEKMVGGDSWHVPKTELVGALEAIRTAWPHSSLSCISSILQGS